MGFSFGKEDIEKISGILKSEPQVFESAWSWKLENKPAGQSLVFTLYNDVELGSDRGSLVSVQTLHGYFELHGCTGYLVFEPDEIIFVQASKDKLASLIVGKECTCSMFSNISRSILSADFTALDPAVLLSAMQLSLTETLLP
jgi:hypothetical protein